MSNILVYLCLIATCVQAALQDISFDDIKAQAEVAMEEMTRPPADKFLLKFNWEGLCFLPGYAVRTLQQFDTFYRDSKVRQIDLQSKLKIGV